MAKTDLRLRLLNAKRDAASNEHDFHKSMIAGCNWLIKEGQKKNKKLTLREIHETSNSLGVKLVLLELKRRIAYRIMPENPNTLAGQSFGDPLIAPGNRLISFRYPIPYEEMEKIEEDMNKRAASAKGLKTLKKLKEKHKTLAKKAKERQKLFEKKVKERERKLNEKLKPLRGSLKKEELREQFHNDMAAYCEWLIGYLLESKKLTLELIHTKPSDSGKVKLILLELKRKTKGKNVFKNEPKNYKELISIFGKPKIVDGKLKGFHDLTTGEVKELERTMNKTIESAGRYQALRDLRKEHQKLAEQVSKKRTFLERRIEKRARRIHRR